MVQVPWHFTNASGGSFNTVGNWSPASVPVAASTVYLDAGGPTGPAYTVTSSVNNAISWLSIDSNATLDVAAGTFRVDSTVNPWSNADNFGTIDIAAGATMIYGAAGSPSGDSAEIFNTGAVSVLGGASTWAYLRFAAPYNDLLGGGTVTMSGDAEITTGAGNTTVVGLENKNNTIEGAGTIGGAELYLRNDVGGAIIANAATVLTLNASAAAATATAYGEGIENAGVIETTGAGGLRIVGLGGLSSSPVAMENDGILEANGNGALAFVNANVEGLGDVEAIVSGAQIRLNSATLGSGGTISTAAGSSIVTVAGTNDEIWCPDVENAGNIIVANNSTLRIDINLENSGVFSLAGGANATTLEIVWPGADLKGSGRLVLSDSANNFIVSDGSAEWLGNFSNIYGAGTIGDGNLQFVNQAGGLVDANDSVGLNIVGDTNANEGPDYNAGLIETTGAGGLTIRNKLDNAGTLEAAGAGALTFDDATITDVDGVVEATTAGSSIVLDNSTIWGSDLSLTAGSSLATTAGAADTDTIGAGDVQNQGTITVSNGSTLKVSDQVWENSGSMNIGDPTGAATLKIVGLSDCNVFQLLGDGTVDLVNGSEIVSNGAANTLRNVTNMIEGAGTIGGGNLTLQNSVHGVIDANGLTGLTINTGSNTVQNAGTIESNSAAGIAIDSPLVSAGYLIANQGNIHVTGQTYGAGLAEINNAAEVEFGSGGTDVFFGAGADGTLRLDNSSISSEAFHGDITGFASGDRIDLSDVAYVASGASKTTRGYVGDTVNGVLTVTEGADTTTLWMIGDYTSSPFSLSSDGHGGTLVSFVGALKT
ncbi:MAG: hypothetical protein ABR929_07385 [Roseiarcus sp.]|jgi:hypothetical protein